MRPRAHTLNPLFALLVGRGKRVESLFTPPDGLTKEKTAMAGCNKKRGDKPKMKTNRAAAKRFSVTGTGLVKFSSKGHRHLLSNKSRKHKRQQRKSNYMTKGDAGLVARQIPYLM